MSDQQGKGSRGKKSGDKATRIRAKVDTARARAEGTGAANDAPASDAAASGQFSGLRKAFDDHPLTLLAGSVVFGALAASLLPASLGRKLGSRVLGLAVVAGDLGAKYSGQALGAAARGARAGQERLDGVGETIVDKSAEARRRAAEMRTLAARRAVEMAEAAAHNARDARETALKRIQELSAKVRD